MDLAKNYAYEATQESSTESGIATTRSSHLSYGDAYFSADVETDGPIPGPYSMLSFAIVYAGSFDGTTFVRPDHIDKIFYVEVKPISDIFEKEALDVNKLNRENIVNNGEHPVSAMEQAHRWVTEIAGDQNPVLVAYPVSFDWTWLYWYFMAFCSRGSPFKYSWCYDIKTAMAVKTRTPISQSGRAKLPFNLRSRRKHTHHAVDDAIEQAEIFANIFEWKG